MTVTNKKYQEVIMKKLFFIAVALLIAVSVEAADLKIGYVDLNEAVNTSDEGKKAISILKDIVTSKEAVIEEKRGEIKQLEEEIAKQASILNPDAIKEKKDRREKLVRDYQRMLKDSEDEVEKKRADLMNDILKKISTVVTKIGKEEGYSVILERGGSGILYIPENANLTKKVITTFNEEVKAGEIK
jgi:outer membrane protein